MNRAGSRSAQRLANNCAFVHNRGHLRGGQVAHVRNQRGFQPRLKVLPADGGVQQGASHKRRRGSSTQTDCAANGRPEAGRSNRQADRDERAGVRCDVFNSVDNRPDNFLVDGAPDGPHIIFEAALKKVFVYITHVILTSVRL